MTKKLSKMVAGLGLIFLLVTPLQAADRHILHSRVHAAAAKLTPLGRLPATDRLNLVIGLPLRNQAEFGILLQQIYNPASTNFHRYLTPAQLTARFGPTDADYQAVTNFAMTNGLQVVGTYDNRQMVDVSGTVADIEKAFHVTLHTFQHPDKPRQFYAPDVEASVDASLPILDVSGLDNYFVPAPVAHRMPMMKGPSGTSASSANFYKGNDFRKAYVPDVTLTGTGQSVGLYEPEGYYASDITSYESQFGLPNVPLQNIYLDGYTSGNRPLQTDTNGVLECSLDIEMVISMAPALDNLYVFLGNNTDHILGSMITNSQIKQFSSSWQMNQDQTAEQDFQIMQVQGQSFLDASGDGDAYVVTPIQNWPADDPNVTSVGGTAVSMYTNSSGFASYASETVWNDGQHTGQNNTPWLGNGQTTNDAYWGSGGGFSSTYPIPLWQQSINMTAVGGSATRRNFPDVAMAAVSIWAIYDGGIAGGVEGTSCAAPLWAGFTALVNQQAVTEGKPSVGFLNPAIYTIGQSQLYANAFHDITQGSNTWSLSPNSYFAAPGYDLCTGWGSPNGQGLIDALTSYAGPVFVDFNYTGTTNTGTYDFPFKTLAQGVNTVGSGGTIIIRTAGSSSETMTVSKTMTITALGGAATIGH